MDKAVLRPARAAEYLNMSLRQLRYIAEQDSSFPRKITFSPRCVGWRRESLDAWLKDKEAGNQ